MSALGGKPDGICSLRAFPLLTDFVAEIGDQNSEAVDTIFEAHVAYGPLGVGFNAWP